MSVQEFIQRRKKSQQNTRRLLLLGGGVVAGGLALAFVSFAALRCYRWVSTRDERAPVAALVKLGAEVKFDYAGRAVWVQANLDEFRDDDLQHVTKLKHVKRLELFGSSVTDEGLGRLKGSRNLRQLFLYNTDVTADGITELRRELPSCKVFSRFTVERDFVK